MYRPTLEEVKKLASQGNLVPVYREIMADMETPVSAFLKIARGPHSFLLESVEGGERLARYSFIGTEPYLVIKTGPGQPAGAVDPLVQVERELKGVRPVVVPGLPRFLGGAVGYLSYEAVRYFEPRVPAPKGDPLGVPESVFMFTDTLLVFDHVKHKIQLVSHVHTEGDIEQEYMAAVARIEWLAERLRHPLEMQKRHVAVPSPAERAPVSNMTQEQYEAMVSAAREYITAGDVIQVVLSQRLRRRTSVEPFDIYRALRMLNPSPYMYYLHLDDFDIVGASPELLVRVEDGAVATHPIAGTRPRGKTAEEDARLEADLRTDVKERAEHIMLVDLGRNDIGRVSEPGTVKVTELMGVERYSHVMHLVSHVTGSLRAGLTAYDALRACFPAGTVSGAPKIRAMEIIAEREPERRGPYAGAVGYFSFSGNMDTCITIRTIVVKDGVAYAQAGGGIVYDSTPVGEFRESMQKMEGPLRAITEAEEQVAAHADEPRSHLRRAAR